MQGVEGIAKSIQGKKVIGITVKHMKHQTYEKTVPTSLPPTIDGLLNFFGLCPSSPVCNHWFADEGQNCLVGHLRDAS
jgi:hypothetical protein